MPERTSTGPGQPGQETAHADQGGDVQAVVTSTEGRPREHWDDPRRSPVAWVTLFSGDITPTSSMSAGVAEIPPGDAPLTLHRHEQPEIYFILEGSGILTIDGRETRVSPGAAVFIPGNAEHGLRNDGETELKLFYVFPTDRFSDVVYRFSEVPAPDPNPKIIRTKLAQNRSD